MIEYENLKKVNAPFVEAFYKKFREVTESGWFILGEEVKKFESEFATYCGSKFCVGVANGLDALTISLQAFSFPKGAEVIVPSNTYIATILSILNSGLKPVLVEPSIASYNIDPSLIERSITKSTVAIMVVHLYGKCCAMDKISDIARSADLKIIEDCAQAHGASYKGRKVGTFGDFSAFSFYPTKNLGALGDGGSINTDSPDLAKIVRMIRNYGSEKKYHNDVIGVNSRLDELQAALLNVKLPHLDEINNHKRELAALYHAKLNDNFIRPEVHPDYHDVYHIFNVRHPRRDALKQYLETNGIKTDIHYPVPPHRQVALKGLFLNEQFPVSEEIHRTTLSLPISFCHSKKDILRVVDVMNNFKS